MQLHLNCLFIYVHKILFVNCNLYCKVSSLVCTYYCVRVSGYFKYYCYQINIVMEEGFVKGQSVNLPKVNIFMVARYLSENGDYVASEMRGIKLNNTERESYGDEAIGYVQIKREGHVCSVKCRITPEHCVRIKPYCCTLKCNEIDSQILSIACEDCTASRGCCKHSIAFLMWLYRRTDEPAPTSVECYWKRSTLSGLRTSLKFIKAKDFGSQQPRTEIKCDANMFFEKVKAKLREYQAICQLSAYVNNTL